LPTKTIIFGQVKKYSGKFCLPPQTDLSPTAILLYCVFFILLVKEMLATYWTQLKMQYDGRWP